MAKTIADDCQLLEVGCGNGRDAAFLGRMCKQVVALDASQAAIDFCAGKYQNDSIQFVCGTAGTLLDRYEKFFDVLYSRFCLHAMTRPEESEFLSAASRLLNASGKIFIECRSINDALARQGEVISPTERICGHYRRFIVLDELLGDLRDVGFEIIDASEAKGRAKLGDDDPVVIRVVGRLIVPS